jgi:uncharacterized cupin superfamily protein
MAAKIDRDAAPTRFGTAYPEPHDAPCRGRQRWRLGDAAGLTQFGVNLLRLPDGQWSSQRHWHAAEDEFVYVLEGEVVLVTDAGEEVLRAGDCAGFKAGDANGHHLRNRSGRDAVLLEVGSRGKGADGVDYPDIDLKYEPGAPGYAHKDGRPY